MFIFFVYSSTSCSVRIPFCLILFSLLSRLGIKISLTWRSFKLTHNIVDLPSFVVVLRRCNPEPPIKIASKWSGNFFKYLFVFHNGCILPTCCILQCDQHFSWNIKHWEKFSKVIFWMFSPLKFPPVLEECLIRQQGSPNPGLRFKRGWGGGGG